MPTPISLSSTGLSAGDGTWLGHVRLGYNYRMPELSAALGAAQMERIGELLRKRERVAGWYTERLRTVAGVETPYVPPRTTRMSWFVYVVRLLAGVDREAVRERLAWQGIPTRPYFPPIHCSRSTGSGSGIGMAAIP